MRPGERVCKLAFVLARNRLTRTAAERGPVLSGECGQVERVSDRARWCVALAVDGSTHREIVTRRKRHLFGGRRFPMIAGVLLLIDNYDSFTWNLVQRFSEIDPSLRIEVIRNDAIDIAGAEALAPTHLVISPGPCTPKEAGISGALLSHFKGRIPALGVCLGHQAIGDVHGMTVRRNDIAVHGKTSPIHHDGRGLFVGLSNPFIATRYHSLVIDPATVHPDFEVTARTERDEIMGIRWKAPAGAAPLEGVQFHPESFLTVEGPRLLANFLAMQPTATHAAAPSAVTRTA